MKYNITIPLLSAVMFVSWLNTQAQQPPSTDIYLLDLQVEKGSVVASNPRNVTNHVGYDNQPYFHPEKALLYYSSANDEGRTDIKRFDYATGKTSNLTTTPEREYSPTVTPDGKFISCIIQRENGEQNLGKYPIAGGEPTILIRDLVVGYHAWADNKSLIAFILGEPHSLHFIDLVDNIDTTIVELPGRALHQIPGTKYLSYQYAVKDAWHIFRFDPATKQSTMLTQTRDGKTHDIAWTPDGKMLVSEGKDLYFYDTKSPSGWQLVQLPAGFQKEITRLAVNSTGNKLAVVAGE